MEGSGSTSWIYHTIISTNTHSLSDEMGNGTTTIENITDPHLTCEQIQEIFGQPLLIQVSTANVLRYVQAIFYIFNVVFGVFLNLFVVVLTFHYKQLQNVTFILGLQVCVGDMINAAISFPSSAANAICGRFVFTGLCSMFGFAVFFLSLARIYLMFVLVLDRFCTVFMPFWFHRHRIRVVLPLSCSAWMLALIVALIPVEGLLDCYSVSRTGWACFPSQGCNHQGECLMYTWITISLSNLSSVVSLILYLALFCKARKLLRKVAIAHQPNVSGAEERAADARRLKREQRANVTFFLFYLALIGVAFPPVIILFIGRAVVFLRGTAPPTAYSVVEILVGSLFPLLTIIDPLVIMRNEDFREVIKKLLNKIKAQTTRETSTLVLATET